MTIPVRVKRAGKWWHDSEVTISQGRDGHRKKIRLSIGEDLRIEVTSRQATELINHIADTLEGNHHV